MLPLIGLHYNTPGLTYMEKKRHFDDVFPSRLKFVSLALKCFKHALRLTHLIYRLSGANTGTEQVREGVSSCIRFWVSAILNCCSSVSEIYPKLYIWPGHNRSWSIAGVQGQGKHRGRRKHHHISMSECQTSWTVAPVHLKYFWLVGQS